MTGFMLIQDSGNFQVEQTVQIVASCLSLADFDFGTFLGAASFLPVADSLNEFENFLVIITRVVFAKAVQEIKFVVFHFN